MEMKKVILIMLITIILTGCNGFTNDATGNPEGKVIVDGERYTMMPGDLEWKEDNVEIRTTGSQNIYELAELFETLEVNQGDTVKFEIDKKPISTIVTKLNEDGTTDIVQLKGNEIMLPSESGYYIYELQTKWTEGNQTFVFDVYVQNKK